MANGTLKVENIQTSSGSGTITIGQSGETITSSAVMGSGMGKVLQAVTATNATEQTSTSTSFVASTLQASITPSSTSNKILIMVSTGSGNNTSGQHCYSTIYRGTTNLGGSNGMNTQYQGGTGEHYGSTHMSILDSPASTSQQTYTLYYRASGGTAKVNSSGITGTITLQEITA